MCQDNQLHTQKRKRKQNFRIGFGRKRPHRAYTLLQYFVMCMAHVRMPMDACECVWCIGDVVCARDISTESSRYNG